MFIFSTEIKTPIGNMIACANNDGICLLEFTERKDLEKQLKSLTSYLKNEIIPGQNEHLKELEKQLHEFFTGVRKKFNLPLVLTGTQFQKKVWEELQKIPFGKAMSYQGLTKILGDPKAIRAVARANGANKMAILIPCHRIIGSDGNLTGYAGGLARKKWLLGHESKQLTMDF